ncbi:MAG: hypothetical protein ACKOAD_08650 [Gammaproteobacteria bacterium]
MIPNKKEIQNSVLDTAEHHLKQLQSSLEKIKRYFPISQEQIKNLTTEEIAMIDSLVYRFSKLQDLIGAQLINICLDLAQEPVVNHTMIDKINKLSKFGVAINPALWSELREIRNQIAHEYPNAPDLVASKLNELYSRIPSLIAIYKSICVFLQKF